MTTATITVEELIKNINEYDDDSLVNKIHELTETYSGHRYQKLVYVEIVDDSSRINK